MALLQVMVWDRIRHRLFGDGQVKPSAPIEPDMQQQIDVVAATARRMVEVVSQSMQIAFDSKNIETRRSRVRVARENIARLLELASDYPFIKIERLADVERDLAKIDERTDEMLAATGADLVRQSSFLKLPLLRQCDALQIPIETLHLDRSDGKWVVGGIAHQGPESAALSHFQTAGWQGTESEGTAVLMLMKAACLDYLAAVNTFNSREDACLRGFEAQCIIHREKSTDIILEIERTGEATIRSNLNEIMAHPRYSTIYPTMDLKAMLCIWRALTGPQLADFAGRLFADPGLRAGWPDLTLARDGVVRFVEVKTTDKLHASQRDLFLEILQPSGADVRVLQIIPRKS